jgi:hypothetical protein
LDGTERSRPLFPYPLYAKYISGDPNDPASFAPENDGTVRWPRFREDTFYAFDILEEENNPFVEGEDVQHFFPYDFSLEMGSYDWQVWSPSMDDEVGTEPGFFGTFEVE